MRRPELKRVRGLADEIARLSLDSLVEAYRHDCVVAPRRPESGKRYLVETHDGRPRSGAFTNRNEEHLALALWNDCAQGAGLFLQPTGLRLHLVDYQVPLKAAQSDRVGKLDLLGLLDDGTLCLVELEAPGERGDSPLLALLEALSYAAVVEANRNALDAELREKFPEATGDTPVVLLLGPEAWWRAWQRCAPAGEWIPRLARVCDELSRRLGLKIACGALAPCDPKDLRHGLHGEPPSLGQVPEVVAVDGLPHVPPPRNMASYVSSMLGRFHRYARASFPLDRFDEHIGNQDRPPVFSLRFSDNNLLTPTDPAARMRVIAAVPARESRVIQ